ncbi:hypothetical protein BH20ACI4_BH20ACI4_12710 [soil metagenome]
MSKIFQNTTFILGFVFGILLFIGLNFYSLSANHRGYIDGFGESGFPFSWMDSGWFLQRIFWFGLIADILFAIIFSFILGSIFKFVWSKISAKSN